jgi:hypothetical protein
MKKRMLVSLAAPLAMMGLLNARSPLRPAAEKLEGLWSCTYVTDNVPGAPPLTNTGWVSTARMVLSRLW